MAKKSNIHIRVDENDRAAFMEAAEIGGYRSMSDMVRAMVKAAVQTPESVQVSRPSKAE